MLTLLLAAADDKSLEQAKTISGGLRDEQGFYLAALAIVALVAVFGFFVVWIRKVETVQEKRITDRDRIQSQLDVTVRDVASYVKGNGDAMHVMARSIEDQRTSVEDMRRAMEDLRLAVLQPKGKAPRANALGPEPRSSSGKPPGVTE